MSVETFHGCPSAWIAAKPTSSTRFAIAPGDKFPSLSLTKFKKKNYKKKESKIYLQKFELSLFNFGVTYGEAWRDFEGAGEGAGYDVVDFDPSEEESLVEAGFASAV